jgi:hypothetical protein
MLHFELTAGYTCIWLIETPKTYFKVQNVRPAQGQYQVSSTAIWELVTREVNGNILRFLSKKELFRFKAVSKSIKSIVKSEKELVFNAIWEQLGEVIKDQKLRSVPNKHKFKLKNRVKIQGQWGITGYVVRTTKSDASLICEEDVFKTDVIIWIGKTPWIVHVCPYIGEFEVGVQHWHCWS